MRSAHPTELGADDGAFPLPGLEFLVPEERTTPRRTRRWWREAPPTDAVAAFQSRIVEIPTGCMVWVGAISTPDGYGRIRVRTGPGRTAVATVSAHRFALWLAAGYLEAEGVAEHGCNEPLCVRVAQEHVHSSTQSANMLHAIDSGRHRGSDLVVDSARRAERSFRVRELVRSGCWSAAEYAAARSAGVDERGGLDELLLW